MNACRLLYFGIVFGPVLLMGQRKEEIQSIQRDVAQLQEQVKQLQRSQDEKLAALQTLLQQAVDASTHVTSEMTAMQRQVDAKLNDQQGKLVAPVATLGAKVDQMSEDFRAVSTTVADMVRRMSALDTKLTDMSSAIRTLSAPPVAPPPGAGAQGGAPPGMSAETSYQTAYRDYNGGKPDLALQEFSDYVRYFPDSANAPGAQYYIGWIYYNGKQYTDAVKAFSAVLDYPENPKTPDALYYKAVSLLKGEQRIEAGAAFREFLRKYPGNEHAAQANADLKLVGMGAPGAKKRTK
jgi:TolA-binding protein